MYQINSCFFNP